MKIFNNTPFVGLNNQIFKLTVFIATYNRYDLFIKALDSVLKQSYTDFQIIILDNNSTDIRYKNLVSLSSDKIKYIKQDKNIGSIGILNFAIMYAQTEYFMVFHDDDIMHKEMLKLQMELIESRPEISAVSCRAHLINYNGKILSNKRFIPTKKLKIYQGKQYIQAYFKNRHDILCPSVIFRTNFIKTFNHKFTFEAGPAADQLLWFDILKSNGKILVNNNRLFYYRIHKYQDSGLNSLTMHLDLLIYLFKNNYYKNEIKNSPLSFKLRTFLKLIKLNIFLPKKFYFYYNQEISKIFPIILIRLYSYFLYLPLKLVYLIKKKLNCF